MKKFEINKKMTEIVQNYIVDGYVINPISMSGSQGEEGKIDLVKGDKLIRVWTNIVNYWNFRDENSWHGNVLELNVGVWKYPAEDSFKGNTLWMKDLDIIECYKFYEIKRNVEYTDDLDEAIVIQNKRYDRYKNEDFRFGSKSIYLENDSAKDIATIYLKRSLGYKRVSRDKIKVQKIIDKNSVRFVIIYNSERFVLN